MTCIAWDGRTLAADKQGTQCDMRITVTKITRLTSGALVAWTGTIEQGIELARWYEDGADPGKWPSYQATDEWARLIVVEKGKAYTYEKRPIPQLVEDPFQAWGSGRDFAMGAMGMGADARKAVEVASIFSTTCGGGVDSFEVS